MACDVNFNHTVCCVMVRGGAVQCSVVCVSYCQRQRDLGRRMNQSVSQSVGQRVLAALPTVQYKTAALDNTHTRTSKSFTTATLNFMERHGC